MPIRKCQVCGVIYKARGSRNLKFCSQKCNGKSRIGVPFTEEVKQKVSKNRAIHGMARRSGHHPLNVIWENMLKRCNNKNRHNYKYYGGRGIKVEWKNFIEFRDDMLESFEKHLEHYPNDTFIDRRDNNGNYSKENCHWVTRKENMNNTRKQKPIVLTSVES